LGPKFDKKFLKETKNPALGKSGIMAASMANNAKRSCCQFATNQENTALIVNLLFKS
jgi:hypothetical protein